MFLVFLLLVVLYAYAWKNSMFIPNAIPVLLGVLGVLIAATVGRFMDKAWGIAIGFVVAGAVLLVLLCGMC